MKVKALYIPIVLVLVMALGGFYLNRKAIDDTYNNAVDLIKSGEYESALGELTKANGDETPYEDRLFDEKENSYKDSSFLYAYALARIEHNSDNRGMLMIKIRLDFIPENYNGELSEEIKNFKALFEIEYNEFLEEEKIKAEKEREEELLREEERIKNSVPYVGMSESRIDDTILGKSSEMFHNSEIRNGKRLQANVYRFKTNEGVIFVARCIDGYVDSVSDHRNSPYGKVKHSAIPEEEFNVNDYYDAEDFYEDYYDDFYEYEEAEEYFNEHHD